MGDATKSLAAEIEAVLRDQIVLRRMGPDSFVEGYEEAAEKIAARIAAIQSRAFEDGARWMRERAEERARIWAIPDLPPAAYADDELMAGIQARNETVAGIAAGVAALPLQPEGERNV